MGAQNSQILENSDEDSVSLEEENFHLSQLFLEGNEAQSFQKSGYLKKLPVNRAMKFSFSSSWKNRFFVLKKGCLFYYEVLSEEDYDFTDIEISDSTTVPIPLLGNEFGYMFEMRLFCHETHCQLKFATKTETDLEEWKDFLTKKQWNSSKKEGLIMHQNVKNQKWIPTFLSVEKDRVSTSHRKEKNFFPLSGCQVSITNDMEFSFCLTCKEPPQTLVLSADTLQERNEWIEAIQNEIQNASSFHKKYKDKLSVDISLKIGELLEKEKEQISKISKSKKNDKFFILSIDGGGIRGIITTIILERLVGHFPNLLDHVDFIAGCSIGGMVSMSLAFGHSASFCRAIMEVCGNLIFKTSLLSNSINSAKFSNQYLKLAVDSIFHEKKLKDAKKYVMLPAFLMDNHCENDQERSCEARIFHNFHLNQESTSSENELASDVVMRSAMAPTFFPSYQQYVDGGFFAHDPSSLSLMMAISPQRLGKNPKDIIMLSLGTGRISRYYDDPTHNWGYVQWIDKFVNCFWDGMLMKSRVMCEEMLGTQYHRVDPLLKKEHPMDDPAQIPALIDHAKSFDLNPTIQWIKENIFSS